MNTKIHGEIVLRPEKNADMTGAVRKKDYVVAHSETGHDHILLGDCLVLEREGRDTLIQVEDDAKLFHKKTNTRHNDITVKNGIYRVLSKKTYNPYLKVIKKVRD